MARIEYFYSAHSAFAYLGSARLMVIARAAGNERESVRWLAKANALAHTLWPSDRRRLQLAMASTATRVTRAAPATLLVSR